MRRAQRSSTRQSASLPAAAASSANQWTEPVRGAFNIEVVDRAHRLYQCCGLRAHRHRWLEAWQPYPCPRRTRYETLFLPKDRLRLRMSRFYVSYLTFLTHLL